MSVSAELSGRRLVAALLLFALLPAVLILAAVSYRSPAPPPGPAAYDPVPLVGDPLLDAIQARELQRSSEVTAAAATATAPALTGPTFPDLLPTLALAPRDTPYRLEELVAQVPEAFGTVGEAVLVTASIEVPAGARLVVDAAQTPDVRLTSSAAGFATVIARGGGIDLVGTSGQPLALTSWDPGRSSNDTDLSDGRAFVLALGARMDVTHADVGYLGFGTGTSSGLAWRGQPATALTPHAPAGGEVTGSTLHDSWFGAYASGAQGMRWADNTFEDNGGYGLDLRDGSSGFVVEGNTAQRNGRHGFILARNSDDNALRTNVARDNRGHGFLINDGGSEDTVAGALLPSDDNELVANTASGNDGSGIEIAGGTGTRVSDNVLEDNHVGVRIRDGASVTVAGNVVSDSRLYGLDVLEGDGDVVLTGNTVTGGYAGVSLARPASAALRGNEIEGASAPYVVAGESVRDEGVGTWIAKVLRWNPLLVLWTAILGLPVAIVVKRLLTTTVRRRRLPRRLWT